MMQLLIPGNLLKVKPKHLDFYLFSREQLEGAKISVRPIVLAPGALALVTSVEDPLHHVANSAQRLIGLLTLGVPPRQGFFWTQSEVGSFEVIS